MLSSWTATRCVPTPFSPYTRLLLRSRGRRSLGQPVWTACVIALLLVFACPVAAQLTGISTPEPTAETPEKESRRKEPVSVPMADIGVESERAKRRIKESLLGLQPSPEETEATSIIPELRDRVDRQLERSSITRDTSPSVLALDRLQTEWSELDGQLQKTQQGLRNRGEKIEQHVETIRKIRTLWAHTRTDAVGLEVSPDVIRQIDEVLQAAEAATTEANERQARVLSLQSDIASLSEVAGEDEMTIAEARNRAMGEVLHRDSPPIWSSGFWHGIDGDTIGAKLQHQETRDGEMLKQYWAKNKSTIVIYLILTGVLMLTLLGTRRKVDTLLSGDSSMSSVRAMFSRPIALSLLISFFCSLWIFREVAITLEPIFGAATLIPAVLVLRQVVDRPIFPLLSVGMSVFFMHQIHELLVQTDVLARLVFLAEMAVLVVFTGLALRPARMAAIPPSVASSLAFRIIGRGLQLIFITSGICLIAEMIGFGALAALLGSALMMGIFSAIVLYGAVRVFDGLFAFLLRIRPLNMLSLVRRNRELLRRRAHATLIVFAWISLIRALLTRLEVWDDLVDWWQRTLEAELPFPEVTLTIGNLISAIVVFAIALLASRFLQFVLAEEVFDRSEIERGRPYAISTLLHYLFLIVGFVLAVAALGFDANRATLLTGAFGVGIGFGLQTIVNNFISGIILLTERPVQVGDTVVLGNVSGEIQRIGIRSSTVRTWQGAEVIVPNANLIAEEVTNWTKTDRRRRLEIPVGVAYGSNPRAVIEILAQAAAEIDGVLDSPEPYVIFQGFGDSSLDFEVRAWTSDFDHFVRIRSKICIAISDHLAEAGIEIPFPQRDLHLRDLPPGLGEPPQT